MASILPMSLIYLEPNRLAYYTRSGRALSLDIPKDVVSEFEVISREKLSTIIREFVTSKKIDPSSVAIIFSQDLCFEKNFPELPTEQKDGQTRDFFDTVPFDRVLSRVYPFEKGSKAIAVNRDYYEAFLEIFGQLGFQFFAVIPVYALSLLGVKSLDSKGVTTLMNRSDAIRQQTMVLIRQPIRTLQEQEEQLAKEHTPLILFAFFLFIALVIAVTFVILNKQSNENRGSATITPIATSAISTFAPSSALDSSATNSGVLKDELEITILAGSSKREEAQALSQALTESGFSEVKLVSSSATRSRVLISVSSSLANQFRQEIAQIVQEANPSAVLQELDQDPMSINIDMGR